MATYTPEQVANIFLRTPDRITAGMRVPKFGMGKIVSLRPSLFNNAGRAYRDATLPEELESLGFSRKQMSDFVMAATMTNASVKMGAMANLAWHSSQMVTSEDRSTRAFTTAYAELAGRDIFMQFLTNLAAEEPGAFTTGSPDLPPGPVPQTA